MAVFKYEIVTDIPEEVTSITSYLTWVEETIGEDAFAALSTYIMNERDSLANHARWIDEDTGKLHAVRFFNTPAAATVSRNSTSNLLSDVTGITVTISEMEEISNDDMNTIMLQDQNHI